MSLDIHGIVGQGSIRQPNNPPQPQTISDRQQEAEFRSMQQTAEKSAELQKQVQAETVRQQEADAARRAEEARAVQQASRADVEKEVQKALKELKNIKLAYNHKLKYSVNYDKHEITVQVLDPDTDEIIKELPPVAMQKLHSRIQDFIGLLVDEEA